MSYVCVWDSNALRAWIDARDIHHDAIRRTYEGLFDRFVHLSAITVGELEYGLALPHGLSPDTVNALRRAARILPVLGLDRHVSQAYGELRAALFKRYSPGTKRHKRSVSQLFDPVTDRALGIQENDLWIAAQAIARDAVLVTNDRMERIREIASELKVVGLDGPA